MNRKTEKALVSLSNSAIYLFLLSICIIVIFAFITVDQNYSVSSKKIEGFCGTSSIDSDLPDRTVTYTDLSENGDSITFNPTHGRNLFKVRCASCHKINDVILIAPGLGSIFDRIPKVPKNWIYLYLTDSELLRKSGDEYSIKIYKEYKEYGVEFSHKTLRQSKQDLDDLIGYIYLSKGMY